MDGWNYFNYFTEIEEYFWKKRGAHLLVSPLDWAIMETWQRAAAAQKDHGQHPEMAARLAEIAESLRSSSLLLDSPAKFDFEDLERRLTVLDDKLSALVMIVATEELLLRIRREVDGQLSAYRRKMKAEQLALVEKKYTQKRLLEEFALPRLSLYYFS